MSPSSKCDPIDASDRTVAIDLHDMQLFPAFAARTAAAPVASSPVSPLVHTSKELQVHLQHIHSQTIFVCFVFECSFCSFVRQSRIFRKVSIMNRTGNAQKHWDVTGKLLLSVTLKRTRLCLSCCCQCMSSKEWALSPISIEHLILPKLGGSWGVSTAKPSLPG